MRNDRWRQPGFLLSTFRGGDRPETLALLVDAGFNLVEFTFRDRTNVTAALEACEELGLASVVQDPCFCGIGDRFIHTDDDIVRETLAHYSRFKHILGYYIWDEPTADCFGECRNTTDLFKKHAPDKLAFSVVFPSYGVYTWEAGTYNWENNTYVRYIDGYLETVDPDVFSMDYYVFQVNPGVRDIRHSDLWRDLGYCRKKAVELGKPQWFYYQGLGAFDPPDGDVLAGMTPGRLRVQMSAALAYGVKQLTCFCAEGLVFDADGSKTRLFDPVREINRTVRAIGDFLFDKTSRKIYHTGIDPLYTGPYFLDDLSKDGLIESAPDDLVIGRLAGGGGKEYLVVVNKRFEHRAEGAVKLRAPRPVSVLDTRTGLLSPPSVTDTIGFSLDEGACLVCGV